MEKILHYVFLTFSAFYNHFYYGFGGKIFFLVGNFRIFLFFYLSKDRKTEQYTVYAKFSSIYIQGHEN